MVIPDQRSPADKTNKNNNNKVWGFKLPFLGGSDANTTPSSSSSSSSSTTTATTPTMMMHQQQHHHHHNHQHNSQVEGSSNPPQASNSVSSVARSLLPTRRRLKLDPASKLYFPYEPGKQVRSAIRIKNTSKSHVAFKFQTTAPKSCFMRPPGAILAPGESIIATVFKFVEMPENNEKPMEQKSRVKFKIMSLKVKGVMDYVPELFDEQKDQVAIEQILRVIFLDPERPSPTLEKLKRQLADADAAVEARKKPPEDAGPRIIGEGLVIDEWKERRERYLARQQGEGVDSV
ncbi:VESICLE-ASSOCIATED MEMBRANE PROTEIN-ASSOCIATED PROTEIN [Salix purpurea]|uniref:VESICLE-ASSOCIATED MEMBRANE PROTEIN-ASSOCIATED PROTEIN n=1 Tax=Salix purpurea TaxID=77065 RepID=A0A9Q0WPJ7_SALPP|nr:VESICLE-ASSOCIATED MEMBRANE PROTEIN-ASSOCIATED PROTEIN [Salix purpurea]